MIYVNKDSPTIVCAICGKVVPRRAPTQRCCSRIACRRAHHNRTSNAAQKRRQAEKRRRAENAEGTGR